MLNVKKYFPEIKFIATHMGGFMLWDEIEDKIIGDNHFYLGTSSAIIFMKKTNL